MTLINFKKMHFFVVLLLASQAIFGSSIATANEELWQAVRDGRWDDAQTIFLTSLTPEDDLAYLPPNELHDVRWYIQEAGRSELFGLNRTQAPIPMEIEPTHKYEGKSLRQLNGLLKKRGLKKTKTVETAVQSLQANDTGHLVPIPEGHEPESFHTQIQDPYRNRGGAPTELYRILPRDVWQLVFSHLDDDDLFSVNQTCRLFYFPSKNISIRRLAKIIQDNWPTNLPQDQAIISGQGLTPAALKYFFNQTRRTMRSTHTIVRDIVKAIQTSGSVEGFYELQEAKKIQKTFNEHQIKGRLSLLNEWVTANGYSGRFSRLRAAFRLRSYDFKIGFDSDQTLTEISKKNAVCNTATKPLLKFLKEGVNMEPELLRTVLETLSEQGCLLRLIPIVPAQEAELKRRKIDGHSADPDSEDEQMAIEEVGPNQTSVPSADFLGDDAVCLACDLGFTCIDHGFLLNDEF